MMVSLHPERSGATDDNLSVGDVQNLREAQRIAHMKLPLLREVLVQYCRKGMLASPAGN